jgi:uncharacterized SAM-binding protein YcdF (DUF218 family)
VNRNTTKRATQAKKGKRPRRLFRIVLVAAVVGILAGMAHRPILTAAGRFLVVDESPGTGTPADAVVVLGGGDPARALEAAAIYRAGKARFVVLTTENPPRIFEELKRNGVELFQNFENYRRVLAGYGVPANRILRIEEPVGDTLEEIQRVREFTDSRQWRKLIVVTSNFHTRRTKMVARWVREPEIETPVTACRNDSFDPESWWRTQSGIRTFAIETEKLVSYSLYLWPKLLWR